MQNFSFKKLIGGGFTRVIIISLFATLACTGIIKAATTIGTNITTSGTITGSGANTLYGATSIGGALTATSTLTVSGNTILSTASSTGIVKFGQINSDTGSVNFGDENLYTTGNIGIGTSSPYAKLSVVGEVVASYFTATSTAATSTLSGTLSVVGNLWPGRDLKFSSVDSPYINSVPTFTTATSGGTFDDSTTYCYTVTFYTANGETDTINTTSNPYGAPLANWYKTTGVSGSNTNTITLNSIPLPPSGDTAIIGRRIYRGVAGCAYPSETYLVKEIADRTTQTWTDTGPTEFPLGRIISQINTTGGAIYAGQGSSVMVGVTGAELTSWGWKAGANNHGLDNTYIGYRAGEGTNTDCAAATRTTATCAYGKANVGLGDGALMSIAGGNSNVAIGSGAGVNIKSSTGHIYIGSHAGEYAVSNSGNVGIGVTALQDATTSYNIGIGESALMEHGSGTGYGRNISVGYDSGRLITSGSYNTILGTESGRNMTTMDNSVLIGYRACYTAANCGGATTDNILFIDSSDTATPLIFGSFADGSEYLTINGKQTNAPQTTTLSSTALALTRNVVYLTCSSNALTTITGGITGQIVTIKFADACTITDNDGAISNTIDINETFQTFAAKDALQLLFDGISWYEAGHSDNT